MKATATARKKSAAKAAVSDLPAGQALKSASLPVKSKKRKHRHSIEEVGRSDNAVGDWQQRADAERIVGNIFATTNDNPERMEATLKRVTSHPALHRDVVSSSQTAVWDIKTYASSLAARKAEKKRKRACSELQAS